MAIILNTFAAQIICALAVPLLLVLTKPVVVNPDPDAQKSPGDDRGEIDITENKSRSFYHLFRIGLIYIGLLMLKVHTYF